MEFPTGSTNTIHSTSGTLKPQLSKLEAMIQSPSAYLTTMESSTSSPIGFQSGDPNKLQELENPLLSLVKPEEIETKRLYEPRRLKMRDEDFFAWRQVLGRFQEEIKAIISS